MDYGVSLNKEEAAKVLKHFDRDGNGQVDFNEFIRSIRGEPNAARKAVIRQAYNKLDVNKDGKVTLEDVSKIYNVQGHPEVVSGRKSQEQVFVEFMSLWDTQKKDAIVTFDEFVEYYSDISAGIDDDAYFTAVLTAAWKL